MANRSYFTMETIKEISEMHDLAAAKKIASKAIDESNATVQNKNKGHMMVQRTWSVANLTMGMTNFFLAHPAEGLGTLK